MRQGLAENIICLAQNVWCSVNRLYWRTQAHLIEIVYLLIRSTARFIISLQGSEEFKRTSPEENDLSESRASFGSRRKLVAGTAIVVVLGMCTCAYFLLASSNKTVPQTAELSAAVQAVPASPVQTGPSESKFFAAAARSDSLFSKTPGQPAEPLDASQKVAWAALPTMPKSLTSVPARTEDILFLQRAGVNIRSTPSASGSVVATALKGTRFKVTGREADWVQVQNGRLRGWINAQFLAPAKPR
jgi:Bacterial SH3 domain